MDLLEVHNKYTIRLYSRYAEKPLDFVVLGEDLSAFLNDDYDFVTYIRDKAAPPLPFCRQASVRYSCGFPQVLHLQANMVIAFYHFRI